MKQVGMVILLMFVSQMSMAQFGISGGVSSLLGFGGSPKPYIGIHLGGEMPRNDQNSLFARIGIYAKQKESTYSSTYVTAIDQNTTPYLQNITYQSSMNYTIIEGGNRYYIGDGYDSGFGGYGGGTLSLTFNNVKRNYSDYDKSKYVLDANELSKGTILNLGFGLCGGIKHTLAGVGTIYFDATLTYFILSTASNTTASSTNLYAPLLFTFNLGFRKDLY